MKTVVDPRRGDIEDDASSTKRRSLLSLVGSLLGEISLPRLAMAWTLLLAVPGLILGFAPIVASAWIGMASRRMMSAYAVICILLLVVVVAVGWFGGRGLFRLAESSFWSLHSLAVQPGYAACREGLRHLAERMLSPRATAAQLAGLRAAATVAAGLLLCSLAALVLMIAWPSSHWTAGISDFTSPHRLAIMVLANCVVLVAGYLAAATLVWTIADATMAQPRDLDEFHVLSGGGRTWRIAHLSDIHVVGERYGFRIESGRSGPRGNERLRQALKQLEVLDANDPLDAILITGDVTDAGRSAEWAEFLDALASHPQLAERVLVLPGNHDVNIVDRANPARLHLPTSPNRRVRRIRVLSAIGALQGQRVRVVDQASGRLGGSLTEALEPHLGEMAAFADTGRPHRSRALTELWTKVFPMVLPPDRDDGLGFILLNSNADTHFSFTNALGIITVEQARGIETAAAQFPRACWVIALHHHPVEYPRVAKTLAERIGTALINGKWFVRRLRPLAGRAVLMHGHRHIDWIGECAGLLIVSAPSPVMEATDDLDSYFYIQTLAVGADRRLRLLHPQRITVEGQIGAHSG